MIALEGIEKIITLALMTGKLQGVRPQSVMVVAKKESAKTEMVAEFATNDGVLYLNNFTPTSFMEQYISDYDNGKYHHLIIPDLLSVISRQKYLIDTSVTFLNAFMEEGVKEITSKAYVGSKIVLNRPVRGGLITTIAKEDFEQRWKRWTSVGFLTRFLLVSYQYGQDIVRQILISSVTEDEVDLLGKPIKLPQPSILKNSKSIKVVVPKELGIQLKEDAEKIQARLSTYGFRAARHLRRLAQANALVNNRDTVTQEDIDQIKELVEFCNLDYKTIGEEDPPKFREDYNSEEVKK